MWYCEKLLPLLPLLAFAQLCYLCSGAGAIDKPPAGAARKSADWARMTEEDWKAVEAQWDADDDPEERKLEDQFEYERMMEMKAKGAPPGVDLSRPDEYFAASQSMGHTMMFATIANGYDLKQLAGRWQTQLYMGGVETKFYEVEDRVLLATLQRGWNGIQMKDFLTEQIEVEEVKWSDKIFPGAGAPKKKRSKKRKKSSKKVSSKERSRRKKQTSKRKLAKKDSNRRKVQQKQKQKQKQQAASKEL